MANENDENNSSARLTRAKTAALAGDEVTASKAPLAKKAGASSNAQPGLRKRAALGDVSNVTKADLGDGKKATGKTGLVSKAARPAGIQKSTSRASSRPALTTKEPNKKVEVKQSGPGAIGAAVQKRKLSSAVSGVKDQASEDENPVHKKVHTAEAHKQAKTESVKQEVLHKAPAPVVEVEPPVFEYPEGVKDLDSEDQEDPLMVAEYAVEIFEYLRDLECNSIPNPQYMSHQDDLEWKTRGILIDWLIEVHTRFHLLPETLFLAVNIIDRFLSEKVVQLD